MIHVEKCDRCAEFGSDRWTVTFSGLERKFHFDTWIKALNFADKRRNLL